MIPYYINIDTVAARFRSRSGEFTLHSISDFIENDGPPMEADLDEEQVLDDPHSAWVVSEGEPRLQARLHTPLDDLFARFEDRDGNIFYCSMSYLHDMGAPVCEKDDKPLDLDSSMVFVRVGTGSLDFAEMLAPGQPPGVAYAPQARYEVQVTESRTYNCTYYVVAGSVEEAQQKAERGETESETDGSLGEVSDREVVSTPKFIAYV